MSKSRRTKLEIPAQVSWSGKHIFTTFDVIKKCQYFQAMKTPKQMKWNESRKTLFLTTHSRNNFCWHRDCRNWREESHCWQRWFKVSSAVGEALPDESSCWADSLICRNLTSTQTAANAASINMSTCHQLNLLRPQPQHHQTKFWKKNNQEDGEGKFSQGYRNIKQVIYMFSVSLKISWIATL